MLASKVLNIFMEEKITPFWMEEYLKLKVCVIDFYASCLYSILRS
jgi:hypothetical protein